MNEVTLSTCTRCGATIATDDLNAGLAVRVDGSLVCEMCVDTLPGEAVVRINRMRALKGLEVTTYQVTNPKTPTLQLYSFTTAANVTTHRRKLVSDGFYEAPKLPPPGQRAPLPVEPKRTVTDRVAPGVRPGRTAMLIAAGATVAILLGIAITVASLSSKKTTPANDSALTTPAQLPPPEPPKPLKTRFDYAVDPIAAWVQVTQDIDCPNLVRQGIAQELIRKRNQQLDTAEEALAERRLDDAAALANGIALPDDITFRAVRDRENDLRNRLLASRTMASIKPPIPTKIEPTPTQIPVPAPNPEPVAPPPLPVPTPIPVPVAPTPVPVAPTPTLPTPVAPTPPSKPMLADGQAQVWNAPFIVTNRDKKPYALPFDGNEFIPENWPGGIDAIYRSSRALTLKRHAMFFDLKKTSLDQGGLALLLHPLRIDRKSVVLSLTDAKGKTITLPPVQFTDKIWTSVVIPLPVDAGFDAMNVITLGIEDHPSAEGIPEDGGFIIGKLVLVHGRAPTESDLGLRPTALLPDLNRLGNIPRLVKIIAKNRKRSSDKRFLELDRVRMVIAGPWSAHIQVRSDLSAILKNTYGNQNPDGSIINAIFTDAWLDTMTKGRGAPLDPTQTNFAIWWTSAAEMATWPNADSAIANLWKKRIDQLIDAGIIPIVVIGPNGQSGATRAAAEAMWQQFITIPQIRLYSIPVIDLRAMTTAEDGSMDPETANRAIRLIGDALLEFNYIIRRQGAIK